MVHGIRNFLSRYPARVDMSRINMNRWLASAWWVPLALVPTWLVILLIVVYVGHVELTNGLTVMANVAAALAVVVRLQHGAVGEGNQRAVAGAGKAPKRDAAGAGVAILDVCTSDSL